MIRRTCPVLSITPQRSPARGCRPAGPNQGRALRTVECLRHVTAPDHRHRDLRQPQAVADHINQRHGPLRRFFRIRARRSQQAKRKKQNPFPYIGSENSWNLPTFYYIYTTLTTLQHGCKDRPRLERAARSRIRKTLLRRPHAVRTAGIRHAAHLSARQQHLPRLRQMPVRQAESGHHRSDRPTGSASR